jgi:hypothetical protein
LARAENGDLSVALPVFTCVCDYFPNFAEQVEKDCVVQISPAASEESVPFHHTNLANTPTAFVPTANVCLASSPAPIYNQQIRSESVKPQ